MPFLSVIGKSSFPEVDQDLLESLGGPGTEAFRTISSGAGHHWLSPLCRVEDSGFASRFGEPGVRNGAWFRVVLTDDGMDVERDELGMLPLWLVETERFVAISPQFKYFAALRGFRPELRDARDLTATVRRSVDFSPLTNVARLRPAPRIYLDRRRIIERKPPTVFDPTKASGLAPEEHERRLERAVAGSARELSRMERWTCLLSGGIDSSVAASLVRSRSEERVLALTLGSPLGDEFPKAEETARELAIDCRRVMCAEPDLLASFEEVVWQNEVFDGLAAEIVAQLNLLVRCAGYGATTPVCVVTGYGADLLFGGMMQHAAYLQAVGVSRESHLVERSIWTNELSPLFAWRAAVRIHHLFLHPEVIRAALEIPIELNLADGHQKYLLRQVASKRGWLSPAIAFVPKLGLTDGTRAHELLSHALGLDGGYNFAAKTKRAVELLRTRLEEVSEPR